MEIVEVNGVKYSKDEARPSKGGGKLFALAAMASVLGGGMDGIGGGKETKRPDVDIVKEFELIEQKKSSLTKSQRDWVEYEFKMNYTKIIETE